MNAMCMGESFVLDGKDYWRCLLDSTIVEVRREEPICPHCDRLRLNPEVTVSCKTRKVTLTQVKIAELNWITIKQETGDETKKKI